MKRIVLCICCAGLSLMTSGCTIESGGLKEVARSIDGMRAQLDKTTKEGGDLDRLLEQARRDVDGMIEKAAREGGKARGEVRPRLHRAKEAGLRRRHCIDEEDESRVPDHRIRRDRRYDGGDCASSPRRPRIRWAPWSCPSPAYS